MVLVKTDAGIASGPAPILRASTSGRSGCVERAERKHQMIRWFAATLFPARRGCMARRATVTWAERSLLAAWLETLLLAGLFGLALLLRLPYLTAAPELSDEIWELDLASQVYQGTPLLVAHDAYVGALPLYLVAAVWRILGVDPSVPRLFRRSTCLGESCMAGPRVWLARSCSPAPGSTFWSSRTLAGRIAGVS